MSQKTCTNSLKSGLGRQDASGACLEFRENNEKSKLLVKTDHHKTVVFFFLVVVVGFFLIIIIIFCCCCSLLSYCASHHYSCNFSTFCEELPTVTICFTRRKTVSNIHDALQETNRELVATKHSEVDTHKSLI